MNMKEASAAVFPFPKKSHYILVLKYLSSGSANAPTLREFSNKSVKRKLKKDAFREGILRGTKKVPGLVKMDGTQVAVGRFTERVETDRPIQVVD